MPGQYLGPMGQHHHHMEPTGDSLAGEAKHMLEQQGEQWTDMRAAIFDVLASFEKPASAYDIADLVSITTQNSLPGPWPVLHR